MLRVTIDIFSGRPNPTWIITEDSEVRELLGMVSQSPDAVAEPGAGYDGLGFRELSLTLIGDELDRPRGVPAEFALASTACADLTTSGELARRIIGEMTRHADVRMRDHEITALDGELANFALDQLERFLADPPARSQPEAPRANPLITTVTDSRCQQCSYEVSQYNPGFWNSNSYVLRNNNCYNYARNWRTDTFAQPGRAHGAQTSVMACSNVSTAAKADGLRPRCTCLPGSENPRRMMALVVAPGYDYHWFREQRGGFWGHKPGQTAARYWDNAGKTVLNPETADRGPYTNFCGYFYAGRSVVIT